MSSPVSWNNWIFYGLGIVFVLLGISFFWIPLLFNTGALSNVKVPPILLYVYNKGGFYFATSPILLIISAITVIVFIVRR